MKKMFRHILAGVSLALLVSLAQAAEPSTRKVALNITASSLARALIQFTEQTGLQLVFPANGKVQDLPGRSLVGTYTPQAALEQLLTHSGLRYEYIDAHTVAIRAAKTAEESSSHLTVADQMRLAGLEDAARKEKSNFPERAEDSKDTQQVEVKDRRVKPFTDANVDLPRTIDDVQPYYIFDAQTIEQSGATNIEDFLKQRLTMNTTALTSGQNSSGGEGLMLNTQGSTSSVNLRGLGDDKTLILVNGRRRAAVVVETTEYQTDLNGIPLSAIDRIEVLPSSASGIYGASAVGGVVNVILKSRYSGGEVRTAYENTWDTDSHKRTVSASYGFSVDSKTHLLFNAQWSDSESLVLRDRRELFEANMAKVRRPARPRLDFWPGCHSPGQVSSTTPGPRISIVMRRCISMNLHGTGMLPRGR